ncbi:protein Abitram [Daktulosphaira vitifoliae]|uniref:protein Abitram n=1 Tax=Daktulosphaira vitifoliae TaxID=58002 RepID=UPI0021A9D10D|nr:protein Abitram [Daktulosphaira vitifoliae]
MDTNIKFNSKTEENNILPIEKSIEIPKNMPSFIERYFECRYAINVNGKLNQDYRVLIHSNNLFILTIAPSHILMGNVIEKIDFQVSDNTDRSKNKMSGKGKRGAQVVQAGSTLFKVTCSNKEEYKILSPVPGKLVEINAKLSDNPNLMLLNSDCLGFIAVVIPQKQRFEKIKNDLLTQDQYHESISSNTE